MDLGEIRAAVDEIRARRDDPEIAHSLEDGLYVSVLREIALGRAEDPRALALEALRTQGLNFDRWGA